MLTIGIQKFKCQIKLDWPKLPSLIGILYFRLWETIWAQKIVEFMKTNLHIIAVESSNDNDKLQNKSWKKMVYY